MADPTSTPTTATPTAAIQDSGVVSQQPLARAPQVLQKEEGEGGKTSLWMDPDIQAFAATVQKELKAIPETWKKGKDPFGMSYLQAQCALMETWWKKQERSIGLEELKQRWQIGIQNQMSYFKAYTSNGFGGSPPFPEAKVELEPVPAEVSGPDAAKYPPVSKGMAAFLRALWQVSYVKSARHQCFVAKNYSGHNKEQIWGKKSCSIDLYLATAPGKIDRSSNKTGNGFWEPQQMVDFILLFDEAATLSKVKWWHGLYNDFRVISTVNTSLKRQALGFKGSFSKTPKANWHGPDPLGFLHLHLDIVPEPPAPPPPQSG